jgi:hypothetical protein
MSSFAHIYIHLSIGRQKVPLYSIRTRQQEETGSKLANSYPVRMDKAILLLNITLKMNIVRCGSLKSCSDESWPKVCNRSVGRLVSEAHLH